MFFNEADNNITEFNVLDLEKEGVVHYNQTNVTLFHYLTKQRDFIETRIDDEMLRHIDLTFE